MLNKCLVICWVFQQYWKKGITLISPKLLTNTIGITYNTLASKIDAYQNHFKFLLLFLNCGISACLFYIS